MREIKWVLDVYNPLERNKDVEFIFYKGDLKCCVRRIEVEYYWGEEQYIFPERDWDNDYLRFKTFNTLEEARHAAKGMILL